MRHIQRSVSIALAALTLLLTANLATAQSIAKLDPRALAVGGAYVAAADGTPQLRLSADLDLLTEKLAIPGRRRREVDGAGTYGNERDGFGYSGALAAEW